MHAALITDYSKPPAYATVDDLPQPTSSQIQLKVLATGLHNLVRSRARGAHYSSPPLPQIPGTDGVGVAEDGTCYYFSVFKRGGSFAQKVNVERSGAFPMPKDLNAIQTAALVNPAISSWMAITARTKGLPENFSVLILGATSASGRLAASLARTLGAKQVFGAARNASALERLPLDIKLHVAEDPSKTDFSPLQGVEIDVILDYINGPLPTALLSTHKQQRPLQYVQIGTLSGQEMVLPNSVLRSTNLTIRGSGLGAFSQAEMVKEVPALLEALVDVEEQRIVEFSLEDVEEAWDRTIDKDARVVLLP